MLRVQSLYGMSLRSTMSLVSGWHFISLQTPGDFQSISLVFLITYHRQISVYSLPKLITKCMVVTPRSMATASRCCWRPLRFKYRSWGRNIIFQLYLIHMSLLKQRRYWLLQCALAYATHVSMLLFSFKRLLFKIFKFVHLYGSLAPNTTHVSAVRAGTTENENLSAPQKELLKWHWKLGTSLYCIQEMMREWYYDEPNGNKTILRAIIKPKLASA
jgi:hypothetical protein